MGQQYGLVCCGATPTSANSLTHAGFHLLNPGSFSEGPLALVRIELDCTFIDLDLD